MRINAIKNIFHCSAVNKLKSVFRLKNQPMPKDCFEHSQLVLESIKSKTVEKLFSPEFQPKRKLDATGCRVTTVIDRKTQKPVEALVAGVFDEKNPLREEWLLLVNDKNGEIQLKNNSFRIIGKAFYHKNPKVKMLMPSFAKQKHNGELYERVNSYMQAFDKDKYQGIGVRLHQLRMERMFQLGYENSLIVADGNSYLFHKNMGFEIFAKQIRGSQKRDFLSTLTKINKHPYNYNSKYLCYDGGKIDVASTLDNMLTEHYQNSDIALDISPNMILSEKSKSEWSKLISRQPILS